MLTYSNIYRSIFITAALYTDLVIGWIWCNFHTHYSVDSLATGRTITRCLKNVDSIKLASKTILNKFDYHINVGHFVWSCTTFIRFRQNFISYLKPNLNYKLDMQVKSGFAIKWNIYTLVEAE